MNCADVMARAEAYALGALEPAELAACDAHLAAPGPHTCGPDVEAARALVASVLQSAQPVRSGDHVWAAIERATGAAGGAPARARVAPARDRRLPRWAVASIAAAAGALAAAALVLLVQRLVSGPGPAAPRRDGGDRAALIDPHRSSTPFDVANDAVALLVSPAAGHAFLTAPGGSGAATGAAVRAPAAEGGRLVVLAIDLPRDAGGLRLWIVRGGAAPTLAGALSALGSRAWIGEADPSALAGDGPPARLVIAATAKDGGGPGATLLEGPLPAEPAPPPPVP